jgi:hypothetical protein
MKKIAGVRPLIRHDKLEVNPKALPAEQVVIFGLDDFTKPDRQSIQSIEGSIASRRDGRGTSEIWRSSPAY